MGKESKKGVDICICITDSLYCTLETNTMMQTNYTTIKIKKKTVEYLARFQVANRYRDYIYVYRYLDLYGCWCYSVVKLCLTLHHMDCSMPGFAVLHYLEACPNSCPSSWWCYLTMSSSTAYFFCLQSFPASGSFPMRCLIALGGQSVGASSVLPMNSEVDFL